MRIVRKNPNSSQSLAPVILVISFWSIPARADIGIPMLVLAWPGMGVAFVPIVAIEAWVFARRLPLRLGESVAASILVNAFSTLVGIPVTWALLLVWEMFASYPLHAVFPHASSSFSRVLSLLFTAPRNVST